MWHTDISNDALSSVKGRDAFAAPTGVGVDLPRPDRGCASAPKLPALRLRLRLSARRCWPTNARVLDSKEPAHPAIQFVLHRSRLPQEFLMISSRRFSSVLAVIVIAAPFATQAQSGFRTPPDAVQTLMDAPAAPRAVLSPDRRWLVVTMADRDVETIAEV